jgi:hypothetical protein
MIAAASIAAAFGGSARADNTYLFSMDTTPFVGNSAGPFYLDFQLSQGGGGTNNNVTLSDFTFGGGSAGAVYTQSAGTPFLMIPPVEPAGGASGSAATQVELTDDPSVNSAAASFNELIEAFTPGNSLSFMVDATANLADPARFTPDEFSFGILEGSGAQVPTTAPNGSSLLTGTYNSPTFTFVQYQPLLPAGVPLPSPAAMVLLGLPLVAWARRRISSSPR